jgi:hypothetical protein
VLSSIVRGLWMMYTVQNVQAWSPTPPEDLVEAMQDLGRTHPTLRVGSEGHRFGVALVEAGSMPLGVQFTGRLAGSASGTTLVGGVSGIRRARMASRLVLVAAAALLVSAVAVATRAHAQATAEAVIVATAAAALLLAGAVLHRQGRLHRELLRLMEGVFVQGFSVDQGPH